MEAAESIGAGSEERVKEWALAHQALSKLRLKRAGLDAEEGTCLLRASRAATHVYFGFASFGEYIERLFGLSRRATEEKLRVAEALEELPELADALRSGRLNWSVVRELCRVAVPETEREWLAVARGRTAREVERLVSGLGRGDRPTDRRRPELVRHVLRLEVGAETLATFREAMRVLQKRSDHRLDDDAALLSMAREVLGGPSDAGRASYQVVVTVCEDCGRGFQHANGKLIQLDPAIVEMCHCDAQRIPVPHLQRVTTGAPDDRGGNADDLANGPTRMGHADDLANGHDHTGHSNDLAKGRTHVSSPDDLAKGRTHVSSPDDLAKGRTHVSSPDDLAKGRTHVSSPDDLAKGRTHVSSPDDLAKGRTHVSSPDDLAKGRTHVSGSNDLAKGRDHTGDSDELARADAQLKRRRAAQDTPPAIRREVFWRDRGRCVVPGCRNATYVDVHHLDLRSEGGSNDPDNLVVLCGAHHGALHRGRLRIDGKVSTGPQLRHADGTAYGCMPSPLLVDASARAFAGLRNLGFSERIARASLEQALSRTPADATAETLLRSAVARASGC